MRKCKSCGENVNELDAHNGLCSRCCEENNLNVIETKNISFWKYLFNWKYFILPIILLFNTLLNSSIPDFDNYTLSLVGFTFLTAIIQTWNFKSSLIKKIPMFFISYLLFSMAFIMPAVILKGMTKVPDVKKQKIIDKLLSANKSLPKILSNEMELVKYTNPNPNTIVMHSKFVNFTKDDILKDYSNNISEFKKDIFNKELICSRADIKTILSTGLDIKFEYKGKNSNVVLVVDLDNQMCKPYYK